MRITAAAAVVSVAVLGAGASPAAAAECGPTAMAQPFIDHLNTAHFERSPLQQAKDLLMVDQYVLTHTVLAEAILAPLVPTAEGVVTPFIDHLDSAHLERSPIQQAKDLADLDDYTLTHTVLVESMLAPLLSGEGCAGPNAPAPTPMPPHGGMPGMTPEPAPAPAPVAPTAAPAAVEIHGYAFAPKAITVPAGTTVTWTNHDGDTHTVTGSGSGAPKSKSFGMDGIYSFTFPTAGTYSYACSIHPNMKGTVTVQ